MYKSFDLLEKMYFVRTGGSLEELKCANILLDECSKLNVDATLESFLVDGYEVKKAKLEFKDPDFEVECCGVGMSGSTPQEGFDGDFVYVESVEDAQIKDIKDKICLVHSKLVNVKQYKKLVEKQAKALILCCGNVYDDKELVDLDPYMYREKHYKEGKIPAVCIRMKDAERVLCAMPKKAHVEMVEEEKQNESHNVVATIKGEKYPDEVVVCTAHYDSVSYSKGAYDNATGSTAIMQLLAHFAKNKPARTMKFVWCGSEEMGLLGSKAYVAAHKEELENYRLCINIDMLGVTLGSDIACATADNALVNYIKYLACEVGFAIAARQGVYSSDSTPFADAGVPAVSFARVSPAGGATIHSRKDVIDHLSAPNYYRSCDYIIEFASHMVNSVTFPVEKNIPDNMKEEIAYYYGLKERK